jgi:ankyrin repeat protein
VACHATTTSRDYVDATKILLAAGVDVTVKNQGGYTALGIAEFNDYPQIVQLLRAFGALE